ncbi:hypothetical protein [Streptomyces sp. NPDC001508]
MADAADMTDVECGAPAAEAVGSREGGAGFEHRPPSGHDGGLGPAVSGP